MKKEENQSTKIETLLWRVLLPGAVFRKMLHDLPDFRAGRRLVVQEPERFVVGELFLKKDLRDKEDKRRRFVGSGGVDAEAVDALAVDDDKPPGVGGNMLSLNVDLGMARQQIDDFQLVVPVAVFDVGVIGALFGRRADQNGLVFPVFNGLMQNQRSSHTIPPMRFASDKETSAGAGMPG